MAYIGKQPRKAALTASDIEDGIITAAKIEDGAVVAAEIASNAVTTAKINADAVTSAKIADNAVVTAAINADAVTGAKIADDAINSEHYTDGSVDTAHIADDNVTYAKIQNVSATDRILGRDSSGAGIIEEITPANLRTMLNVADGATAGGGKVISFASDMNMADFSTTSSSFVDVTDYYVDISPSNSNNNVLVLFNFNAYVPTSGQYYAARIKRTIGGSSTTIGHGTYGLAFARAIGDHDFWGGNSIMILDSPNTTSSTRYQIQWSNAGATGGAYLGANSSNVNKLFAMELEV